MGRYLLIEFEDKEPAATLMKQINKATRNGKSFRVVGYYASPDGPYCQCPVEEWTHERGRPYAPSKFIRKYGWVKCLRCELYRDNPPFLRNLLGVERLINPRTSKVNYKGKRSLMHYFSSISAQSRLAPGTHE